MKLLDIFVELRGQEIVITNVTLCPAEPDVGIFNSYPDGYTLKDSNGKELDWYPSLTKEENAIIDNAIANATASAEDDE